MEQAGGAILFGIDGKEKKEKFDGEKALLEHKQKGLKTAQIANLFILAGNGGKRKKQTKFPGIYPP